ncbi:MAG: flagellar biosynthetic protein FliO [Pirellulaceae bacterium]
MLRPNVVPLIVPLLVVALTAGATAQQPEPTIVSGVAYRTDALDVPDRDRLLEREVAEADGPQPIRLSETRERTSIPLPPPSKRQQTESNRSQSHGPVVSVVSSLAIVLGLFCGFVWLTRKAGVRGNSLLGNDVLRVMGTATIDSRHQAAFIRCGDRLLCVALTQSGATTLAEFTDPTEINELVAKIEGKSKASFAEALRDVGEGQPARGFLGDDQPRRRGLFHSG